jgi:hypothetical protein
VLREPRVTYNECDTSKGCDVKCGHLRVTFILSEEVNSFTDRPCFIPCAVNVVDRDGVFEFSFWESLNVDPFFIGKEI